MTEKEKKKTGTEKKARRPKAELAQAHLAKTEYTTNRVCDWLEKLEKLLTSRRHPISPDLQEKAIAYIAQRLETLNNTVAGKASAEKKFKL